MACFPLREACFFLAGGLWGWREKGIFVEMNEMKGKSGILAALAACLLAGSIAGSNLAAESRETVAPELSGKAGRELTAAIGEHFAPVRYVTEYDGEHGLWETLKVTDGNEAATGYVNRFSDEEITYGVNGGAPRNMELLPVAPARWWRGTSDNYNRVEKDLLILFVAPSGTTIKRAYAFPGEADAEPEAGERWSIGQGSVGGTRITLWEPPEELKGDVARVMMYVAAVYGSGIRRFDLDGGAVWADEPADCFTGAYASQLMVWHRMDPPSEYERQRNSVLGSLQGNENPFVTYPDLAEYLWGQHAGEVYGPGSEPDPTPGGETDTRPLRAVYSLTDACINLRSPYVPEDAVWSVDGRRVEGLRLVPAELGAGVHELKFESPECTGAVKIEVK